MILLIKTFYSKIKSGVNLKRKNQFQCAKNTQVFETDDYGITNNQTLHKERQKLGKFL